MVNNVPLSPGKITSLVIHDFGELVKDLLLDPTLINDKDISHVNFNKIPWMPVVPVINIPTKRDKVDKGSNKDAVMQEMQSEASLLKVPTTPIINTSLVGKCIEHH